jgi:hypothetical protein
MGPRKEGRPCVGACVAWCDMAHVYAASVSVRVYVDMGIHMHTLSYTYLSIISK